MQEDFHKIVFHNSTIQLINNVLTPKTLFIKTSYLDDCTGICFVDSIPLKSCKNKYI